MRQRIIHIAPQAPRKPLLGQPCNGCGICCIAEPCPLGMVLSGRRTGPCVALRWDATAQRYDCGAVPAQSSARADLSWWQRLRRRLVLRWIGAGVGCDCAWEAEAAVASSTSLDTYPQENHHGPR